MAARKAGTAPTAYYSKNSEFRSYHLDLSCRGAERMKVAPAEEATLAHTEFTSLRRLAEDPLGRPCRLCAQERVLHDVLGTPASRKRQNQTLVSFSSQGNPTEKLGRFRWGSTTERGEAQLKRIADRAGLEVAASGIGPIAFGFVPARSVEILSRNLRTIAVPGRSALPRPEVVALAWTLIGDEPPELRAAEEVAKRQLEEMLAALQGPSVNPMLAHQMMRGVEFSLSPAVVAAHAADPWELAELALS